MARSRRQTSTAAVVAAAVLVILFAAAAGVRPGSGLYSPDTRYRLQTDAMFRGTFALQPVPHGQRADWAWGHGSQQVWGLGVALLRMPGEALARVAGRQRFPDRVTLIALFAVVMVLAARQGILVAVTLGTLPAFITLVRTRMFVYEEAVAFAYLWAALQLVLVMQVARTPAPAWMLAAAAVAGFGAHIRPTQFLYGVVTLALVLTCGWVRRVPLRALLGALVMFCAMTATVLWTNHVRFGDPLEFGQRVNVSRWVHDQFAKNFDYPYAHEPLASAARELTAALVTGQIHFTGSEFYQDGPRIHPSFSPTLRFREFYFSTWLGPFLAIAIFGWLLLAARLPVERARLLEPVDALVLSWSLLSFILIAGFYLRMPTLTSRYVVDFAPAIAAAVIGVLLWMRAVMDPKSPLRRGALVVIPALLLYGNVDAAISQTHAALPLSTADRIAGMLQPPVTTGPPVPTSYRCRDAISNIGIPFNAIGWAWNSDCSLAAGTTLYMSMPPGKPCLDLALTPLDGNVVGMTATADVEVKLGTTPLERRSGESLVFCAPSGFRSNPTGIDIVSIKWVPAQTLTLLSRPQFGLQRVSVVTTP